MSHAREPRRAPGRLRAVAAIALASLSCTTVRVPASGIPPTVRIRGDAPEPQVELWIESSRDVSPEEAARAAGEARAALEQALAGRRPGEGDQLLVVRAQGVSRTGSRRTDQKAAVAGMVVAAVAIVAVAVVAIVSGKGKGGGGGKVPAVAPRPAPPPGAVAVRPPPAGLPRPAPPPGGGPALPRPAGHPGHLEPSVAIGVDVQVAVPVPPPNGPPPAVWGDAVLAAPAPEPGAAAARDEVVLPPPPPLDVERRGYFDGDSTRLELTLVDRATRRPLWVKTVESGDDPRDARAVRALLDRALDDPEGWRAAQ